MSFKVPMTYSDGDREELDEVFEMESEADTFGLEQVGDFNAGGEVTICRIQVIARRPVREERQATRCSKSKTNSADVVPRTSPQEPGGGHGGVSVCPSTSNES